MTMSPGGISDNGKRMAKNTLFLYFRMLLLLAVGLFTSRVVLKALGVEDFGTYNVVGGVVSMFTLITSAVSTAISRYMTCELGKGDAEKLRKVFSTSVTIQLILCALVLLLTETLGIWFTRNCLDIPEGRSGSAIWVLQCSAGILMASLLSVPFNAVVMAHEHMKAFALISIVEAFLKLGVALFLLVSSSDKLKTYSVLMLATAIIIRFCYGAYCHKRFEESRAKPAWHPGLTKEMSAFAGWNLLGSGSFLINTQGVNILTNIFFGVAANAARGVAAQVEGIVKQFVNNVIIAINPQITKSYVSGDKEYSFDLVRKGSRYAGLIILTIALPVIMETDFLLKIWLGNVPEGAALFTRLTMAGLFLDLLCTTFSTLILAHGDIRKFYLCFSCVSLTIFPLTWMAFKFGAPAWAAYVLFIAVYLVVDAVKLVILHAKTGFGCRRFLYESVFKVGLVALLSFSITALVRSALPEGWARLALVLPVSCACIATGTYFLALTPGERVFVKTRLSRHV